MATKFVVQRRALWSAVIEADSEEDAESIALNMDFDPATNPEEVTEVDMEWIVFPSDEVSDKEYLSSLPLTDALWWFIENVGDDHPERNDLFFLLRERMREGPR